jgi:hypothetical protein
VGVVAVMVFALQWASMLHIHEGMTFEEFD